MPNIESRSSHAVRMLAQILLRNEGNNLPTTRVLADQAGVGVATVAKALEFLGESGAVKVVRVQRYGTTIEHLDWGRLWLSAGYGPLRGIVPMSLSSAMQGIEVAIARVLEAYGIEFSFSYQAGASVRLEALEAGKADFALVSKHALVQTPNIRIAHEFPVGSYYGTTGIYRLLRRGIERVERVGADTGSPDHVSLVKAEFPGREVVSAPFRYIPALVAQGKLDASVWYGGAAVSGGYINLLRTESATSREAQDLELTSAVLISSLQSPACNLMLGLDQHLLDQIYTQVANSDDEVLP